MNDTIDLSIIIVSWNVKDYLRQCLRSIRAHTKDMSYEIFVVDNHSSDGSAEMVGREFPEVHLVENADNYGFAKANNQALVKAKGRFVLFLNPDTELLGNALKDMVVFMDSHPEASGMAPKLVYDDRSLQRSCRRFPSIFTDLMESLYLDERFPNSPFFNRYRYGGWQFNDMRIVDQPAGASLLFRKSLLDGIGGMDERFFMYFEEVDLCYRVKKSGGNIFFVPSVTMVHHANKSTEQARSNMSERFIGSKLLFFDKNYGRLSVYCLLMDLLLRSFIETVIFPVTNLLFKRPRDIYLEHYSKYLKTVWRIHIDFIMGKKIWQ